ncbi:Man1-Src1p-C-terminal domain-containing protein [Morchella snyderi]|nr:Man1-Src1p-C-terminal domain-containing protein [Morchella snyderi]
MDNENDYLQPGFDPATLKVQQLRQILLEHNIDFPSNPKKAQLVELFTQHVAPKARTILNARSRVKPSSRGIVDVGRDNTPSIEATPRRSSRHAASRVGTVDTEEEEGTPRPAQTPGRSASVKKASGKHTRVPETDKSEVEDQGPLKSIRKTRNSSVRQSVIPKAESPGDSPRNLKFENSEDDSAVFSSHNPFQSGSPPATRSPEGAGRRKTLASEKKGKSLSARRRADFISSKYDSERDSTYTTTNTHVVPSSKKFEVSLSKLQSSKNDVKNKGIVKKEEEEESYSLEPGEEFTPEETEEIARDPGALRRRTGGQSSSTGTNMLWAIVIALLSGYFMWWRKEKKEVGYCGLGKLDMQTYDPDWTSLIRPQCEPCPPNAICRFNYEADCKDDYVLVPNPLSFGGLVPLPPTCEPDSEKLRRIAILSDEAIRVLRERAADVECGEASLGKDEEAGVSEADLRQVLYDLKAPSLSDAQFNELWRNALEDVSNREEVVSTKNSQDVTYLQSTSFASISLGCAIRKSITGSMVRHRIELIGVILIAVILTRLRSYIATNRHYKEQVTQLVHVALQQLAQHATHNPTEPWIGAVQLRDQVLQHEFNPQRRKRLWDGVQKIVEMNSNVRAGEREISGEVMRVWTWIGGRISSMGMANGVGSIGEMEGNGCELSGNQPEFSRVFV